MLEGSDTKTLDAPPADDAPQLLRDLIERLQGELKFHKTRNEALNLEIARLKRWRFGSSSESLQASTQAVLFDAILADTAIEDRAAQDELKPAPATARIKRQAVRQALPRQARDEPVELLAREVERARVLARPGEAAGLQAPRAKP